MIPPASATSTAGSANGGSARSERIDHVLVLGGGSAGFIVAITLKKKIPALKVTLLRSKDLGIIGVGEGTTTTMPYHLMDYLRLDIAEYYRVAQPQWKLGIRFIWGTRPYFNYVFGNELDAYYRGLSKVAAHYFDDQTTFDYCGMQSALMEENKVFARRPDGSPELNRENLAFHIENELLVQMLERNAAEVGVIVEDDTVNEAMQDDHGVIGLKCASGREFRADLFVDCSGFYSYLLGKTLKVPFESYNRSLFCDRAVVGGWARADEPIKPYTTAETMDAGWCWQIEHEFRINRGYVYSSPFISDNDAEAEFRRKNPKIEKTRIVKFPPGKYEKAWVKNVVAIGNASGFVEPLEATSLGTICLQTQSLTECLMDSGRRIQPALVDFFNLHSKRSWDTTRDFLAAHYKFNKRINSDFWRACQEKVELNRAQDLLEYWQENGPSTLWRVSLFEDTSYRAFGLEGYFAMFLGMGVPYRKTFVPTDDEKKRWRQLQLSFKERAAKAYSVKEALELVRSPQWEWPKDMYIRDRYDRPTRL